MKDELPTSRMKTQTLRTGLSAAYWCNPANDYLFEPAHLPTMTRLPDQHTAWFDELFEGGLAIPEKGTGTAMTLLVTGAPGTGKTTLCLEFCYRLAIAKEERDRLSSLYVTTEGHAPWLIKHARDFGWDADEAVIGSSPESPVRIKALKTKQDFTDFEIGLRSSGDGGQIPSSLSAILNAWHKEFFGSDFDADVNGHSEPVDLSRYDIVVFDNLNTMKVDKGLWFQMLAELGERGPRLVIVVLDSADADGAQSWDFLADVVIRM